MDKEKTRTPETTDQSVVCDKKGRCSRCDEDRNRPLILVKEVEGNRYVCTQIANFYASSGRVVPMFVGRWGDCPNYDDLDEISKHIDYCASNHELLSDFCKIIEKLKSKDGI